MKVAVLIGIATLLIAAFIKAFASAASSRSRRSYEINNDSSSGDGSGWHTAAFSSDGQGADGGGDTGGGGDGGGGGD